MKPGIRTVTAVLMCVVSALSAMALPVDFYASSSRLASGKWRKVRITSEGMHFISDSQLKQMGFSDPAKVRVYGYGGIPLSENLNGAFSDDLPLAPSVRTSKGIVFYAAGNVLWSGDAFGEMQFSHSRNMYSMESYCFLSDVESSSSVSRKDYSAISGEKISAFTETLLHEQELFMPSNSGSMTYGEDFRSLPLQTFNFSLPGKVGKEVTAGVVFATKITNGSSSLTLSANGTELSSSNNIPGVFSSDNYASSGTFFEQFDLDGQNLAFSVRHTQNGGVFYFARLDFIRINYTRRLDLADGPLVFSIEDVSGKTISVAGASSSVRIWDVTDPARIVEIGYSQSGNNAMFSPEGSGYRRYVAFEPEKVTVAAGAAVAVANQDLHSMPVPDMLIVSPAEYKAEAQRLADFHNKEGMLVHVVTPEEIYNEFSSGSPELTAIRKALKMWYDRGEADGHKMRYCLLMGRALYDNRGVTDLGKRLKYPRIPIWQHPTGLTDATSYSTDDYIGMLEDNVSDLRIDYDKMSVAVGRFPVKSVTEARQMVDKTIAYSTSEDFGSWRNLAMIIADDQDGGVHLEQAERVYDEMTKTDKGAGYIYERLYLDAYELKFGSNGNTYPDATERMLKLFNEGVMFVDYIGHGSTTAWGHESLWTYTDITGMKNKRWPIYLTATCDFGRWDDEQVCSAELLTLMPDAGAIAMISSSRKAYITPNGDLNAYITSGIFTKTSEGNYRRLGDVLKDGKNKYTSSDTNKLRFMLIGDPALSLPIPEYNVRIETINGTDVTDSAAEAPVVGALGKLRIEGSVTDDEGNVITDFNGIIAPALYDAERVITTNGNGDDGKVKMYNDRKNMLFRGNVPVKAGRWEVEFTVPSEIEDNFSPARVVCYAYSDKGAEANGSSDRLYVYGYDQTGENDTEGPKITGFTINSDSFREGDSVGPDPVVYATLSDESGINISTVGIGHQLSLMLDGNRSYDNLSDFFSPKIDDNNAGTIEYPLSGIAPGDHTLTLTAWDNAGNSSSASLSFRVSENAIPVIYDIHPDANPATTSVTFTIEQDCPGGAAENNIEIFDMYGRKVWMGRSAGSGTVTWDLTSGAGARVDGGVYLYRATVKSSSGVKSTKTKKLIVTSK